METKSFNKWGLVAVNGVIAILFGALAIFVPGATLLSFVSYFGIVIILLGISMVIGVINNIRNQMPYAIDLAESLVVLGVGVLLTFYNQTSLEVFVIIIGSWAILLGAGQLYIAFKINAGLNSKNTLLINGGISILFGIILYFNPFQAAKFFLILAGILALAIGVILIVVAIKMKSYLE